MKNVPFLSIFFLGFMFISSTSYALDMTRANAFLAHERCFTPFAKVLDSKLISSFDRYSLGTDKVSFQSNNPNQIQYSVRYFDYPQFYYNQNLINYQNTDSRFEVQVRFISQYMDYDPKVEVSKYHLEMTLPQIKWIEVDESTAFDYYGRPDASLATLKNVSVDLPAEGSVFPLINDSSNHATKIMIDLNQYAACLQKGLSLTE